MLERLLERVITEICFTWFLKSYCHFTSRLCSWSVLISSLSLHYELYYQNKKSVLLLGKILKEGHLKVNLHSPMLMFLV